MRQVAVRQTARPVRRSGRRAARVGRLLAGNGNRQNEEQRHFDGGHVRLCLALRRRLLCAQVALLANGPLVLGMFLAFDVRVRALL